MDIEYWVLAIICGVFSVSLLSLALRSSMDGVKITSIFAPILMGVVFGAAAVVVVQRGYEQRMVDQDKMECITEHGGFWVNNQCYTGRIEI